MLNGIKSFAKSEQFKRVVKDVVTTIVVLTVVSLAVSVIKTGGSAAIDAIKEHFEDAQTEEEVL
jgi:hypothetical protein